MAKYCDGLDELAATWIWVDDGPWTTHEPLNAYEQGWADTLARLDEAFG
jgi:hypothetical protein